VQFNPSPDFDHGKATGCDFAPDGALAHVQAGGGGCDVQQVSHP